jgi:pimeloyl-ACP methyl ester carboxylesterase
VADREAFTAEVPGGRLAGWVTGAGPPVLYLHGGPGIGYDSMDLRAVSELESESRVAIFQQPGRGRFWVWRLVCRERRNGLRVRRTTARSRVTACVAVGFAACSPAFEGLMSEVDSRTDEEPWGQAARQTAELSPNAFLKVIPAAGDFVWYEAPGSVLSALRRLTAPTQVG